MNILVLAPHPDDDAIGCGGTIRQHIVNGDHVEVIYMTSGENGVNNVTQDDILHNDDPQALLHHKQHIREVEAGRASQVLGTHKLHYFRRPDGASEAADPEIQEAMDLVTQSNIWDRIYAPHIMENHHDHFTAANIAVNYRYHRELYFYEVWTPIVIPNHYVDITPYAHEKHAAIMSHESQRGSNFAEAALALNRYRAIMSGKNYYYAEAFIVA